MRIKGCNVHSSAVTHIRDIIEIGLKSLQQCIAPEQSSQTSQGEVLDIDRVINTAELYRIAALIYLERTMPHGRSMKDAMTNLLVTAFALLERIKVCTSPWPLFVIALESTTDEHRIELLNILDKMDEKRRIGNVFVMRQIIQGYWKQKDMKADEQEKFDLNWWNVIDLDTTVPCFI